MPEYLYAKSLQMGLPRHAQNSVSVVQAIHNTSSSFELMKEALILKRKSIADRDPYKKVWVLLNRPDCSDQKVQAILENPNISAAYCPVCIEQWFMLHFEEYDSSIRSPDETISKLTALWPQYKKNRIDAYEALKERLPTAMQRAESAKDSIFEAIFDNAPVFTIHKLLTFFKSLNKAA